MPVTYKIVQIPGLSSVEDGYELSNGIYMAVSFGPGENAAPDMFSIRAAARAVTASGGMILGHDGRPVCCYKHASAPKVSLVTGKASGAGVKALVIEAIINDADGLVAECAAAQAFVELFPSIHATQKGAAP